MTDFARLLYASLPGLYRDKDTSGQLRAFLEIAAAPLTEIEQSVAGLYADLFASSAAPELLPLIGDLVGADVDASLPERVRRSAVLEALAAHRVKGTADPLRALAERLTEWRVERVDFSERVAATALLSAPGSTAWRVFDPGDPAAVRDLDRAATTVDLRAPRDPADRAGRNHFDNHGFLCTPALVLTGRAVTGGLLDGRFGGRFDERGDVQLLDGANGRPLTRRALDRDPASYHATPRGFTLRIGGVAVPQVRAADLSDPQHPRDPSGAPLGLGPAEVAVDPQLGRFLTGGPPGAEIRVDYLLGRVTRVTAEAAGPGGQRTLDPDGAPVRLVDALDGTPVSVAVRLGRDVADYHNTPRGWRIRRNGVEVALRPILDGGIRPPPGTVVIDADRGRLSFFPGFLEPGDRIEVDHAVAEDDGDRFALLAGRLGRAVPAGVVPLVADTRRTPADPTRVLL